MLYDNANYLVQNNVLGDIRHIRALWHRNNAQPLVAKDKSGNSHLSIPRHGPGRIRSRRPGHSLVYRDSWKRLHVGIDKDIDFAKYGPTFETNSQYVTNLKDKDVDFKKYGYNEPGRADQLAALQPHRAQA